MNTQGSKEGNQPSHVVRRAHLVIGLALLLLMTSGLLSSTRAQGRKCRDIQQITVCADFEDPFNASVNGGGFRLRGNVQIGQKGAPPLVEVEDIGAIFDDTILDPSVSTASYFHFNQADPNTGTTDFILGDVRMINDVTGLALLGIKPVDDPTENGSDVVVGRLFVDPTAGKIFTPPVNAVPVFTQKGITRNANIRLAFVTRVGAEVFFKQGGSVSELSKVDAEFNLFTKKFIGTIPVALKLGENAENPNLEITIASEFSDVGAGTHKVNAFKFMLGGLLMNVTGATVKAPTGGNPAEFESDLVQVLKSDNPGVPNLDPANANLIFAFNKLKYKNGAWEIGGVEVAINNWEFGSAFNMVNQTIGIINQPGTNPPVQAFRVKSTLKFGSGSDASTIPIELLIGRTQVGGVFKPLLAANLPNKLIKLGTLSLNLKNLSFSGDAGANFYGLKAQSVDLSWPAHLGGQTAVGIANFKLGINQERKLQFDLGNGTFGLPPFKNKFLEGNLTATIGVVQETLTITGTGTLAIKVPGNANSAGVVTTAILRYKSTKPTTTEVAASAEGNPLPVEAPALYQPVANTAITKCVAPLGQTANCPGTTPPPPPTTVKPFEFKLSGFTFKLAGFGLTVNAPKGTDDGGFTADLVQLTLPLGMNSSLGSSPGSGITVQGFGLSGDGNVSIQGGGFELAPISVGSIQFVGLKGSFLKLANGNYEFSAAGKLPLPGIEPGTNGGGIGVTVKVQLQPNTNTVSGFGVVVSFSAPPLPVIPIGNTGMNLTQISGSFNLTNNTVTIGFGLTAQSKFAIPIPGIGALPLVSANGNIETQFNPFKFSGNVSLTVLIFQVASASINIGAGQGFEGRDGMNVSANVNIQIATGEFKMRVGKGTPSDPNKRRFAASAIFVLGIPANKYGPGRPPFNIGGIQVALSGGIFTDKNFNPNREATGVKGSVCGPNGNVCVGFFMNLGANSNGGGFLDFTNINKYVLIPAAALRAAAAAGQMGYMSQAISPDEAAAAGLVMAASQIDGTEAILQDTVPIEVIAPTTLVAGITYLTAAEAPVISLRLPNTTTVLTEETVNGITQTFLRESETVSNTTNLLFAINGAAPGTYELVITGAQEYEVVTYELNSQPNATIDSVVCGAANTPGVTVTCVNSVSIAEANATDVTVSWTVTDTDSADALVSVGYVRDPGDAAAVEYSNINFVAEDLSIGAGSQVIDFKEVGTGIYRTVIVVDDHQNGLLIVASDATIDVNDSLAPAVPQNLTATPQAGELLVKWDQNLEKDLAGYKIGFGLTDNPNEFIYQRDMGPKEIVTGTSDIVDAKLWGLVDDTTIFYALQAYDGSGNVSDWTPPQSAKPWAISPNTWNPVPNGSGVGGVEIVFEKAMVPESLDDALTVKDKDGNVLTGDYYFLLSAEGEIIGIGFRPAQAYKGAASATLLGGPDGAKAEDGRTMGANYAWSFAWDGVPLQDEFYLPMLNKPQVE